MKETTMLNRRRLFFLLLFLPVCLVAQAPIEKYYALLEAKPKADSAGGSNYVVYFGKDRGIDASAQDRNVYAIDDADRKLDNQLVGKASVVRVNDHKTDVNITFREGFTPLPSEVLLVDLPIAPLNPYYQSIILGIAAYDITLKSLDRRILLDFTSIKNDGVLYEEDMLQLLRLEVRGTASKMRKRMAPRMIPTGRYAGKDLFDTMADVSVEEVRNFLSFMTSNPLRYMGKDWRFAEIYGSWLMQGAPLPEKISRPTGSPGFGIRLKAAKDFGYPRITAVSQAIYGNNPKGLLNGLVLSINGQSMYGKDVSVAENLLKRSADEEVDMTILAQDGIVYDESISKFPIPKTPGWTEAGEMDVYHLLNPVRRGDKWGYIDASGYEVIPLQFDDIKDRQSPFKSGLEAVKKGDLWGFINLEGNWVLPPSWKTVKNFRDGLAAVNDKGTVMTSRWSFINRQGKQVIPPREIPFAGAFSEGLCQVMQNGKIGFMDTQGNTVIPYRYFSADEGFNSGLAVVKLEKEGEYGYIDRQGKTIIPHQFTSAYPFYGDQALVKKDNKWFLIDKQGAVLVTFAATPAQTFFAKQRVRNNRIRAFRDGKYGFMDSRGRIVIPVQYVDAQSFFSEGLVGVTLTGVKRKKSRTVVGGWFFIDKNGERKIDEEFEEVGRFAEGVCWVKQNGRWGLIDTDGFWKIRPQLVERPTPFHNGISRITLKIDTAKFLPEHFYVYISPTGEMIWQP